MPPDKECECCQGTGLFPVGGGDLADCGCVNRRADGKRAKAGLDWEASPSGVDRTEVERLSLIGRHSE